MPNKLSLQFESIAQCINDALKVTENPQAFEAKLSFIKEIAVLAPTQF